MVSVMKMSFQEKNPQHAFKYDCEYYDSIMIAIAWQLHILNKKISDMIEQGITHNIMW